MVNARRPGGTRSSWATAVVNQRPPVVVSANSCRVLSSPFFSCHYDGRVRASFSRSTTTCDKSLCIKVKKKRRPIASFVVTVHLYGRQTFLLAEAKGQLVYLATSRQLQVADGGVGFICRPSAWVSTRPAPYQKGGHKRNLSAAAAISSITRFSMNWRVPCYSFQVC